VLAVLVKQIPDCDWGAPEGFLNTCTSKTRYLSHDEDDVLERVVRQLSFRRLHLRRISKTFFPSSSTLQKDF
jgi:hypothetical protein